MKQNYPTHREQEERVARALRDGPLTLVAVMNFSGLSRGMAYNTLLRMEGDQRIKAEWYSPIDRPAKAPTRIYRLS